MKHQTQPSARFWANFKSFVLVDARGCAWFTASGLKTWGAALRAHGYDVKPGIPWQILLELSADVKPYAKTLVTDFELIQSMPPGSPERELMAQLLGVSPLCDFGPAAARVINLSDYPKVGLTGS